MLLCLSVRRLFVHLLEKLIQSFSGYKLINPVIIQLVNILDQTDQMKTSPGLLILSVLTLTSVSCLLTGV